MASDTQSASMDQLPPSESTLRHLMRTSMTSDDKKHTVKRIQAALECKQLLDDWEELSARYRFVAKLGEEGTAPGASKFFAVKSIFPTSSESRIVNEVKILAQLRGHPNVASLVTLHRKDDKIVVVMPYCEHLDMKEYFNQLPMSELPFYFASLFAALEFCHSKNIIHRDVKPSNFLYHPTHRHGVLVDFGLAQNVTPSTASGKSLPLSMLGKRKERDLNVEDLLSSTSSSTIPEFSYGASRPVLLASDKRPSISANRAGTRGFRAPEVLVKVQRQTTAIDMWSAGVTLLCFLSRRFPFFQSNDDVEALQEITVMFGLRRMRKFAANHQRVLLSTIPNVTKQGVSLRDLIYSLNPDEFGEIPAEAFQILTQMLELEPTDRLTAKQALQTVWLQYARCHLHSTQSAV